MITIPALVMVLGLVAYFVASGPPAPGDVPPRFWVNPRVADIGRICFGVGLFFVLAAVSKTVIFPVN